MELAEMFDGEDWIMRPVLAGRLDLRDLFDGSVSLQQISLLIEAMDVEEENKRRLQKYDQQRRRSKRGK